MHNNTLSGANIRRYRTLQGISQQQLADYLNVTREMISLIESGHRGISITNLTKLSDLFGIELEQLLEQDSTVNDVQASFAFRADESPLDLKNIALFRKIVLNYVKMEKLKNEFQNKKRGY